MTQDPNADARIEPTEVGANAAETGERQVGATPATPTARHEGRSRTSTSPPSPRWATRPPSSTPTRRRC